MGHQGELLILFPIHQDGEASQLLPLLHRGLEGVREGKGGETACLGLGKENLALLGEHRLHAVGGAQGDGNGGDGLGGGYCDREYPFEAVG